MTKVVNLVFLGLLVITAVLGVMIALEPAPVTPQFMRW